MIKNWQIILSVFGLLIVSSCTPIKSSPKEEGVQMELSLHEVQTNLDDVHHDINSLQTEFQILNGKIKYQESSIESLKEQTFNKVETKLDTLLKQLAALEKRSSLQEKELEKVTSNPQKFGGQSSLENSTLAQYRERLKELEKNLIAQERRLDEIAQLKGTLNAIAKSIGTKVPTVTSSSYRVKGGDSLEKIAKNHHVSLEALKQANNLKSDVIVIGQELQIPE